MLLFFRFYRKMIFLRRRILFMQFIAFFIPIGVDNQHINIHWQITHINLPVSGAYK